MPENIFETSGWNFSFETTNAATHHWLWEVPRRRNLFIPWIFQRMRFDLMLHDHYHLLSHSIGQDEMKALVMCHNRTYIASGLEFYPYELGNARKMFIPSEQVKSATDEKLQPFSSGHKVGVHVRRTDNIQSISGSPLEAFIGLMRQEVERDQDTQFYLATDSEDVKAVMKTHFGSRIHCSECAARRDTPEGIIEAAAEMFTLSRMDKIIGSYYSSFSEMAAMTGSVPLIVAR